MAANPTEIIAALEAADLRSQRLLQVIDRYLPAAKHSTGAHDDWQLAGPALIARGVRGLHAVRALRPALCNLDAGVVVRSMFEHVVTFAWLAVDHTARMPIWVKYDRQQRIRMDNDCRSAQMPLLSDEVHAQYVAEIAAIAGELPSLLNRAEAADSHWSTVIAEHPPSSDRTSFRGIYRTLYRHGSALAHATHYGLHPIIEDHEPGVFVIGPERIEDTTNSFTLAPVVLGMGLVISGVALGWPSMDELNEAFDLG